MTNDECINYLEETFSTNFTTICESIILSPSSRGYIGGAVSEYLLQKELTNNNYVSFRIKEKWEGEKHANHHGDFYFKKNTNDLWFVLESKGVKSNSEKWHKLYEKDKLKRFLFKHADKINWLDFENKRYWNEIINFGKTDLLKKIQTHIDYWTSIKQNNIDAKRRTNKFQTLKNELDLVESFFQIDTENELEIVSQLTQLQGIIENISTQIDNWLSRNELDMEEMTLSYVMEKVKVIETHFVSGTSGSSNREQATPRKDEFNLLSIDLFLRTNSHTFIFANPTELEVSSSNENHLQQNYIVGFIFPLEINSISIDERYWYHNLEDAYNSIDINLSINEVDMQVDDRNN